MKQVLRAISGSDAVQLTTVLSDILLALMVAEIIGTVSSFLRRGIFDPIPFLVVGIIASVRRLLVISAETADYLSRGDELPLIYIGELGVLAFIIAVCAWSINLLYGKRIERGAIEGQDPSA